MKHKSDKLRHKIRVLRRAIREKRGIIIGLRTPPEKREALLSTTREELQKMLDELDVLKAEYTAELDKDKQKNSTIIFGDDDYYNVD